MLKIETCVIVIIQGSFSKRLAFMAFPSCPRFKRYFPKVKCYSE